MKELIAIQNELKVPKNHKAEKYMYRSVEDILEAVKPKLKDHNCILTLSDSIEAIGGRVYVKATATLVNADGQIIQTSAYAREEESSKWMSQAQLTGSSSSYARKYALNGMFCIDDTEDMDAFEVQPDDNKESTNATIVVTGADLVSRVKTKEQVFKEVADCYNLEELKQIYEDYRDQEYHKELFNRVIERRNQIEGVKK